jgi:protein arginine kinase activator
LLDSHAVVHRPNGSNRLYYQALLNPRIEKAKFAMKCQHCEKNAIFHITELTDPSGPTLIHLCEDHARVFFQTGESLETATALSSLLSKQLQLEKAASELAQTDKKTCPMCGITFSEFRKGGRLGCPYDYVVFEEDLEPLLMNIHGAQKHVGKVPKNLGGTPKRHFQLKRLRSALQRAIEAENYEEAGAIRDKISAVQSGTLELDEHEMELLELEEEFQSLPDDLPEIEDEDQLGDEEHDEDEDPDGIDLDEDLDDEDLDDDDLDDDDLDDEDLDEDDLDDDDLDEDDLDEDDLDEDDLDEDDLDEDDLDDGDLDGGNLDDKKDPDVK